MSSNPRYQVLQNEEDDENRTTENNVATTSSTPSDEVTSEQETNPVPPNQSPPPYIADVNSSNVEVEFSNEPPPQYTDVVKLPTYNESENIQEPSHPDDGEGSNEHRSIFFYWLNNDVYNQIDDSAHAVGSDASFMFSFLLALIFNWIGFLISYCFTNNLASYYGAISGFGISLVKWAFIAKRSNWSREFMMENPWFCYAFVLFGWVIFMRGIFAYIQLKRLTNRNHESSEENRCGFFG